MIIQDLYFPCIRINAEYKNVPVPSSCAPTPMSPKPPISPNPRAIAPGPSPSLSASPFLFFLATPAPVAHELEEEDLLATPEK